jgi:hypothetical protein
MVESSGCRPQSGQALSESSNEAMVSLIFFLPVSKVLDIDIAINTDMASCITWINDFPFSHSLSF